MLLDEAPADATVLTLLLLSWFWKMILLFDVLRS